VIILDHNIPKDQAEQLRRQIRAKNFFFMYSVPQSKIQNRQSEIT